MTALASAIEVGQTPPLVGERLRVMAALDPGRVIYTHLSFDDQPPLRLTRAEIWRRASGLAALLQARGLQGKPVLLIYNAGPEFAPAFLGALLAGAIAVPVPAPQFAAQFDRLARIATDCEPAAILSTGVLQAKILPKLAAGSPLTGMTWLATDIDPPESAFEPTRVAPEDIALLQYTSGSTSEPKGVALTHANIAHNLDMMAAVFDPGLDARIVSWLPHFHDMGLMAGVLGPMACRGESILMSPQAFLLRPMRWLEAISDYRAQISGAPNFAYDLCVRWAARNERPALDLSGWRSAFAGAEPIRMSTLEAFADCFGRDGFDRSALTPCYGMAEATVLVTCKPAGAPPATYRLARDAAQQGHAVLSDDATALSLTGCGFPAPGTRLSIVDPENRAPLPTGRIGEVWVSGPQVARGYWNRQSDQDPFGARLANPAGGRWLRTGDLGFLTDAGELVFVDRLKDIIIVNAQNYACHDLELTAAASHPLLTADGCVAVGVESDEKTHIAIIAELPTTALDSAQEVIAAIRSGLFKTYTLAVSTIVFVAPRKLNRTTSGKLQRRLTAQRLSDGALRALVHHGDP
jgi:acyl-CoA synthetase (AMP-forming)/AMP-acid ligase II